MSRKSTLLGLITFLMLSALSCNLLGGTSQLKPQSVIDSFKSAGLETESVRPMTVEDYGLAPMADEGLRFIIPSLCSDCGGRVMYYEDTAYRDKAKEYYDAFGKEMAALFSWTFARDHILVQINGQLPEEQARKYEQALMSAKP